VDASSVGLYVYRGAFSFALDVEECRTGAQRFATEWKLLRDRGVTAERASKMDHTELAVSIIIHMVMNEPVRLSQFVKLRRSLMITLCRFTGRYLSEIMPSLLISLSALASAT
jgi:hypothetical protein